MNAIFQALAYAPSVREYSEHYYVRLHPENPTEKVANLFHGMYTWKYSSILMGGIVNEFDSISNKGYDPLFFLEAQLPDALYEEFFKGFSIVKVSLLV